VTLFGVINASIVGRLIFPGGGDGKSGHLKKLASRIWCQRFRLVIFATNGMNVFAAGLLIQVILVRYAGMGHIPSYIVQTIVSVQLNFVLSRFLTWRDRKVAILHALMRFNIQQLIVTGLGVIGYIALERMGMDYLLANVAVTAFLAPVSFLSSHWWSLTARRRDTWRFPDTKYSNTPLDLV
jgi:putative flippase GtrA